VAVRHATDHIHLVATLARQDGTRPRIWNDFYRVREACLEAERRFGLAVTAPADRTAARRPARAEMEQAARRGWGEAPRTRLRREVCTAVAGARTEQAFFARLGEAGVLVRLRYSSVNPGQVTGYAVGLRDHVAKDGGTIWYGGGKLAADLTLPKLRTRWAAPDPADSPWPRSGLPPAAARGVLRTMVAEAAERSADDAGFFTRLCGAGVLVKLRFSELNPGQVTGHSVGLPGHTGGDAEPVWYSGDRLADRLSLPRLRRRWSPGRSGAAEHPGSPVRSGPRSSSMPRGRRARRRSTSGGAFSVIRRRQRTRRPMRCTSRLGSHGARRCTGPLMLTIGPLGCPTVGLRAAARRAAACAPLRGCWRRPGEAGTTTAGGSAAWPPAWRT
jgi:hypothetical protein